MEFAATLLAVLLFALACNLDTLLLSMGYGVRGMEITPGHSLILASITTLVTWLSLALGDMAAKVLPAGLSAALGGLVLVGIGLWFVLDYLRRPAGPERRAEEPPASNGLGYVSLAAALAVNNAGVGVAAGVTGISPLWAAAGNFFVTLAALPLGRWLGNRLAGRLLGRYALPLSGVLLFVLGLWEVLVP